MIIQRCLVSTVDTASQNSSSTGMHGLSCTLLVCCRCVASECQGALGGALSHARSVSLVLLSCLLLRRN
jgi:hypothetical protein